MSRSPGSVFAPPTSIECGMRRQWLFDRIRSLSSVLPASFVFGLLTSVGQLVLPAAVVSVANSAGGWSAVAFGLVWAAKCRPWLGVFAAIASFLLLNAGYAAMSALRGLTWSLQLDNLFVLMSFVVGPFVGLAAAWMRSRSIWLAAVASALLPAILIGEGIYGLTVIAATTSPVYWSLSIAAGVAFLAVVIAARLRTVGPATVSVALTLIGAVVFLVGYTTA